MDIIPFIIMTVLAVVALSRYLDTWQQLEKAEARNQVFKERERIALRLHRSYCRKLFSEDDRLIYKDEVLDHLVNVLNVHDSDSYLPSLKPVSPDPHPAFSSAEGV